MGGVYGGGLMEGVILELLGGREYMELVTRGKVKVCEDGDIVYLTLGLNKVLRIEVSFNGFYQEITFQIEMRFYPLTRYLPFFKEGKSRSYRVRDKWGLPKWLLINLSEEFGVNLDPFGVLS